MLAPGVILQNRYQIIELLGQGGMGGSLSSAGLALEPNCRAERKHWR